MFKKNMIFIFIFVSLFMIANTFVSVSQEEIDKPENQEKNGAGTHSLGARFLLVKKAGARACATEGLVSCAPPGSALNKLTLWW